VEGKEKLIMGLCTAWEGSPSALEVIPEKPGSKIKPIP
jgi:hypothetical protein